MNNKNKASVTLIILVTLVATAVFFLLKPTLSRSEHGIHENSEPNNHVMNSVDESGRATFKKGKGNDTWESRHTTSNADSSVVQ